MALDLLAGAQVSTYEQLIDRIKGQTGIIIQPYKTKGQWEVIGVYPSGHLFKPGSGGMPPKFSESKNRQFYRAQNLDFPDQKDYFFSDEVEVLDVPDDNFLVICINSRLDRAIENHKEDEERRRRRYHEEEVEAESAEEWLARRSERSRQQMEGFVQSDQMSIPELTEVKARRRRVRR
jgi:hypothetical protein